MAFFISGLFMAIENDFLPFAVGSGANVIDQADYAADTGLLQNGFTAGIADSAQLNKVWRQSSIMAAVIANFIVAQTGQTAIDDGTTATLLENFQDAINASGITPAQFDNSTKMATTAFVKKAGFQFSQTYQYTSGPVTLTAAQAGGLIDLSTSYSGSITLPSLSSLPDGASFYIWSGTPSTVTVQRAGSDTFYVNGSTVTSLPLNNGDSLIVERSAAGGNTWIAVGGSVQLPYSATVAALAPKPVTASGVGQFRIVIAPTGGAFTLPAGGTWAYFALPFNTSGNVATSSPAPQAGVAAGGASPGTATSGFFWYGFAWRLQ